jgi:Nucleoside-diphosphate-sugar epimerases
MKVLVIGASVYLGNSIYKKLKECNDDVYGTCCKSCNEEFMQNKKEEVYHNLNNDKRKFILNTEIQDI